MNTAIQNDPRNWRTSGPAVKALKVLVEDFLLLNEKITKTTALDLEMQTTPDPKNNSYKLVISNQKQNILTPIKNWPRVTGLLTANQKGLSISICPLGKEEKIDLIPNKIGSSWYPPVVINVSSEVKIFSLCQNGKVWYKEKNLEDIGHNPILQKIAKEILLKVAGI